MLDLTPEAWCAAILARSGKWMSLKRIEDRTDECGHRIQMRHLRRALNRLKDAELVESRRKAKKAMIGGGPIMLYRLTLKGKTEHKRFRDALIEALEIRSTSAIEEKPKEEAYVSTVIDMTGLGDEDQPDPDDLDFSLNRALPEGKKL